MRIRLQLIVFMFLRIIFNTMHRMVYPFLSVFARGLGVDLTTFSFAITARSLVGALSPVFAPIADQRGRKFGMLAGVSLFILGMGLVAVYPSLITLSVAMVLSILGKYLFDPAMQAYFGDRIPYEERGTALAVTEMAWSLSFIAGIPLMGWLISKYGWNAPFPLLAALGAVMLLIIWRMIPHEDVHHKPVTDSRGNFRAVLTNIPALAGISISMWASASNELINLIFGVWLEDSFGLKIAALAGASAVIGLSELSGEGLVVVITDKLGKPRALLFGLIVNSFAALALPFIGTTQIGALVGLFFYYLTFEYLIVSHVPLMTELVPEARATLLSFNLTGHSIGRALGAFLATLIYQPIGFLPIVLVSIFFNMLALLALGELTRRVVILPRILAWLKRTKNAEV